MFGSTWSWVVPLMGAAGVFVGVLWTTPPGFAAIVEILLDSVHGSAADSAAYAFGSAASLALLTLVVAGLVCGGIDWVWRRIG